MRMIFFCLCVNLSVFFLPINATLVEHSPCSLHAQIILMPIRSPYGCVNTLFLRLLLGRFAQYRIFNFLENLMIPFDNNGSERGIRKLKIKLKNSCTFRSDFGADAFLELHSIVETAKKHDKTPYNAIQALFKV